MLEAASVNCRLKKLACHLALIDIKANKLHMPQIKCSQISDVILDYSFSHRLRLTVIDRSSVSILKQIQDNLTTAESAKLTYEQPMRHSRKLTFFRRNLGIDEKSNKESRSESQQYTIFQNVTNIDKMAARLNFESKHIKTCEKTANIKMQVKHSMFANNIQKIMSGFEQHIIEIQASFDYLFHMVESLVELSDQARAEHLTVNNVGDEICSIDVNLFSILEIKGVEQGHKIKRNMINEVLHKKVKNQGKESLLRIDEKIEYKSFSSCSDSKDYFEESSSDDQLK